jgi:hypothetical protein
MVQRVVKASTGQTSMATASAVDGLVSQLNLDDIGELEPDIQDMIRAGASRLSDPERELLFLRLVKHFHRKESEKDARQSFWSKIRAQLDALFKEVQTFVRAEKAPTKYTTPDLGQGERSEIWQQRMSRVLQSWRRGKRVDVTQRMADDGSFTLYFDDFGDFATPVTFAVRATRRGEIYSVEFQAGRGEIERIVGHTAREQLKLFFKVVRAEDRGHKESFDRFARRLKRASARAR